MNTCTSLVRAQEHLAAGFTSLRQRLRERALGETVWMEALERRFMLDATSTDTGSAFGYLGGASVSVSGLPQTAFFSTPRLPPAITSGGNGKIYVAGSVPDAWEWAIGSVNANGTPNTAFGPNGQALELVPVGQYSEPEQILVQPDGRFIVIAASYATIDLGRFNPDGSLDASFGGGVQSLWLTRQFIGLGSELSWLTPDGKVMLMTIGTLPMELHVPNNNCIPPVAGAETDMITIRLNSDGTLDDSFAPGGFVATKLPAIAGHSPSYTDIFAGLHLSDGGAVTYFDTVAFPDKYMHFILTRAQFGDNGQLVSWKTIDTTLGDRNGHYIAIAPDGSAYVTGQFGVNLPVVRLDPTGAVDPTYTNDLLDLGAINAGIEVTPQERAYPYWLGGVGSTWLADRSYLEASRSWDPETGTFSLDISKTLPDGSTPSSAIGADTGTGGDTLIGDGGSDPSTRDTGDTSNQDGPTIWYVDDYGDFTDTPGVPGFFAAPAGWSPWDPNGKHDVFDDRTGAL